MQQPRPLPPVIKADVFFIQYAPDVKGHKMKMTGRSPWTASDEAAIKSGIKKLILELKTYIK